MASGGLPPWLPLFDDATAVPLSWSLYDAASAEWTDLPQKNEVDPRPVVVGDGDSASAGVTPTTAIPPFSLATWNIDAFAYEHLARLRRLLEAIHRQCSRAAPTDTAPREDSDTPDVIFLQEVSSAAKRGLLDNPWVRGSYYVSGRAWFLSDGNQPFYSITLVSRHRFAPADLGAVWRVDLPSRYGRYALCCDVGLPVAAGKGGEKKSRSRVYRCINVHLDSLAARPNKRPRQLQILGDMLQCDGLAGGLVAGDFNPNIPEEDDVAVEANGLLDCWRVLQPGQEGFTWVPRGRETFPPRRMDKITVTMAQGRGEGRAEGKGKGKEDDEDDDGGDDGDDGTDSHTNSHTNVLVPRSIEVLRPGTVTQSILPSTGSGDATGEPQARAPTMPIPWSDHCGLYATFTMS